MRIALLGAECEENLALRYIRSMLEKHGHVVCQIKFNHAREMESAACQLAQSGASLAGFSMVFTYRAAEFAQLARRSRELGFQGHLVAGGHFAAFNAEALLRDVPAFDSIAVGEGEMLMCDLAVNIHRLNKVRGLIWRDSAGGIHCNAPATKPAQLDSLPFPTRLNPPDTYIGLPIANILASRGCTHSCDFCSISAWHKLCGGARFRLRDPESIAAELADLYDRGYRIFNFHDDNFFLQDKRRTIERFWRLRGELQSRGVGQIAFAIKSRSDTVDEEVFASLKEWGLFRVFLGIEAGSVESLERLGRKQTLDDNQRAIDIVNKLGIHACFNLLLLNPDSTLEDFQTNVAFLRAHARNPMNFCRTEIYAGTPLESYMRREGRLMGDYWGYSYRIRDPRAQTVFEMMYACLQGRHYGDDCVNHLTMRVDYERQLLEHFWSCTSSLHQQVKDFICRVNLNSCDHLEAIAESADAGFISHKKLDSFVNRLAVQVRRDNQRFTGEGLRLLDEIANASRPQKRPSSQWQTEAAAVIVSSLTLFGVTSCATHFNETEAAPIILKMDVQKKIIEEKLMPSILPFLTANDPISILASFRSDGRCRSLKVVLIEKGQIVKIPKKLLQPLFVMELRNGTREVVFNQDEMTRVRVAIETKSTEHYKQQLEHLVMCHLARNLIEPADVDSIVEYDKEGRIASFKIIQTKPALQLDMVIHAQKAVMGRLAEWKLDQPWLFGRSWSLHTPAAKIVEYQSFRTYMCETAPQPPESLPPEIDFRRKF